MFTNVRVLSLLISRSHNSRRKKNSHVIIPNPTYYIPNYFSLSGCSLPWALQESCWMWQDYESLLFPKDKKFLRRHSASHDSEKQHCPVRQIKEPDWAKESGSHPSGTNSNVLNPMTSFASPCLNHCSSFQSNARNKRLTCLHLSSKRMSISLLKKIPTLYTRKLNT